MNTLITKCAGIVIHQNKYLLVKENGQDYYKHLGGTLNGGETHEECLRRELREELSVELLSLEFYFQVPRSPAIGHDNTFIDMFMYFVEFNGILKPTSEIESLKWFTKNTILCNPDNFPVQMSTFILPKLIKDKYLQ